MGRRRLTDRIGTGFEQKLDELYGQKVKSDDTRTFAAVAHGSQPNR